MKYFRLFPFILIPLFALLTYWGIWNIYFQQDEWNGFGKVIYAQRFGYQSLVRLYGSHFTPFSSLFFALLYNSFSFTHSGYAFYSIAAHIVNGVILYLLAIRLIKNRPFALISVLLFLSARVSSQATTWFAASPAFLPSGFFVMVSMLLFEEFLSKKKISYLIGSILTTIISLMFRENGIFLFVYFLLKVLLLNHKNIKQIIGFFSVFLTLYIFFRFAPPLLSSQTTAPISNKTAIINILKQGTEFFFMSPPQLLFPRPVAFQLGLTLFSGEQDVYTFLPEESYIPIFIEHTFFKVLYVSLWILCAALLFIFVKKYIHKKEQYVTIISLITFIVLSVLPFSALPPSLFMESRHFYLSEIGFALLIGYISYIAVVSTEKSITKFIIFDFIFLFIFLNVYHVRQRVKTISQTSNERILFVKQFPIVFPTIPQKALFLRTGQPTPFQSGVGYLLMVLFHNKQHYHVLLKEDFLWALGSQGYREVENVGFGYYKELSQLLVTYCEKHLSPENVFGFEWDKVNKRIIDHSTELREKLSCST